jgi:hypothetical protein
MSDVLPAELERADGTTVTEAVLAGKIVMLFFSAEWCPACTTFVPVLCASLYNKNPPRAQHVSCSLLATLSESPLTTCCYDILHLACAGTPCTRIARRMTTRWR